jgi:hypothetical protein
MANKKITELQLKSSVTSDTNVPVDDGIQSYRVTATQIKDYILSALSISTGMLQELAVTTAKLAAGAVTDEKTSFTPPTVSTCGRSFHTGGFSANATGTYTTPANVKYIRVRMVGGGGGGNGSSSASSPSGGTNGGNTTFGSSLLTAGGGILGGWNSGSKLGGSATINAPAYGSALPGDNSLASTGYSSGSGTRIPGGKGATSPFGKFGSGGTGADNNNTANVINSGGGSAGGIIDAIIPSPSATYAYTVGVGGTGGTAGTNGSNGENAPEGGYIEVTEYYQ